jgi:hypothetical protein
MSLSSSSSSSSSVEIWNRVKPLVLANSAITRGIIQNRLAQTITFTDTTYNIGKVYCYLMGSYGTDPSYTVNLGIHTCDDDGKPNSLIKSISLLGSEIVLNGWYSFKFDVSGNVPSNQYLSFVMWQENGDEDNYVMWAYDTYEDESSSSDVIHMAWISNDSTNWVADKRVTRSLRIISSFNPYNLEQGRVETNPATLKDSQLYFNERTPSYVESKINSNTHLVIDYPALALSFVIDNSGSMGWNDRFENRRMIMSQIIGDISNSYPNNYLFDFITFGSKIAQTSSVNSNLGQVATINLDANAPTKNTYRFETSSLVSVFEGATYSHNGHTYTISQTISNTTTFSALGDGTPLDSGTLIKQTGSGDQDIVFNSFTATTLDSDIIAYGFKDLEDGHTYIIGELMLDNEVISSPSLTNWSLYAPSAESPSIVLEENGPNDSTAVEILATSNTFARKSFTNGFINRSELTSDVEKDDTIISVSDASVFDISNIVDITDGNGITIQHAITNIDTDSNQITISPAARTNVTTDNQGVVEISGNSYARTFEGTTFQLLVKDVEVSRNVTFFLQSVNGGIMEWEFSPFSDWVYANLYWLDQTAILPIEVFDENNNPFPDGTMIVLEVDNRTNLLNAVKLDENEVNLTRSAIAGDYRVYVESLEGYTVGMSIDILGDGGKVQTLIIKEIGTEGSLSYMEFFEPLQFDFSPEENGRIVTNNKSVVELSNEALVSLSIPLVDVTPVEMGKNLEVSLRQPYDPPSVPASVNPEDEDEKNSIYETLNDNRNLIKRGIIDIPTIDGYAYSRVLPLTEDILLTNVEKDKIVENLLRGRPNATYTAQTEQATGDFDSIELPQLSTVDTETIGGDDYVIETPVFLRNGRATSAMTTTATELEDKNYQGYNVPGIPSPPLTLATKTYTIYPHIREETQTGALKAIQYFDPFEINFANPIKIHSDKTSTGEVVYYCENIFYDDFGCFTAAGYKSKSLYGVHAEEGPIIINYVVANKGILVKNGTLNITIYSNSVFDQNAFASSYNNSSQTSEYINQTFPPRTENVNGELVTIEVLSEIDQWRQAVSNNPFSQVIESTQGTTISIGGQQFDQSSVGQYYASIADTSDEGSEQSSYNFYSNPSQWTLATQYEQYKFTIPIVNGKAQLEIPANQNVATLFVEAKYDVAGTSLQAIRADLVMVRNPLMIGGLTPYRITPTGNPEDRWELGGTITWKDGDSGTIEDNTTVNYITNTTATPSVSSTDNGWAGGVFLGPKDQIIVETDPFDLCPPEPIRETVTVIIVHSSGWTNTITRNIYWIGTEESDSDESAKFYFKVTGGNKGYADGTLLPPAEVISDLYDGDNETSLWVGEYGVKALQGLGQPDGLARPVGVSSLMTPRYQTWDDSSVTFLDKGLNKSIGHHAQTYGENPSSDYVYPWDREISMVTSYYDSDGNRLIGQGLVDLPYPSGDGIVYPRPVVSYDEPLGISMETEGEWTRDGATYAKIIATVTWRGEAITNKYIINKGEEGETIIDQNFPIVTFFAGEGIKNNSTDGEQAQFVDYRGKFGCVLDVSRHRDINLTSTKVKISLSRTYEFNHDDTSQTHYHTCTVDKEGDGQTDSVISTTDTVVPSHIHTILNYKLQESLFFDILSNEVLHTHELRSVAITEIKPTTNTEITADIIGLIEYDPTNCKPYKNTKGGVGTRYPISGNRMMFDSISLAPVGDGEPTEPKLILELNPTKSNQAQVPTYYAAETPEVTERGFNIEAKAYFTSYVVDDGSGGTIPIQSRDVTDGSRIIFDYKVFVPPSSFEGDNEINTDVVITGTGVKRNYMWLVINANISTEGYFAKAKMQVAIDSNLNWLPGVKALVNDPTNDPIYIANASSYISTMGSSTIYDSLRLAARRMIRHQDLNPSVKDYKKALILLSDGDESKSEYSLDQAITSVLFMDEHSNVPIIPVSLGQTYSADEVVLKKMYIDTSGFTLNSIDIEQSDVSDLVDFIFTNPNWIVGKGVYRNKVGLGQLSIPNQLSLEDVFSPSGTDVEYRYRTSVDGVIWGLWSDWLFYNEDHTIEEDIDAKTLYFEYEIRLTGNSDFVSPEVRADTTIRYYYPSDFAMFFNPVNVGGGNSLTGGGSNNLGSSSDITSGSSTNINPVYGIEEGNRFISSIHITHEADIPSTSSIQYGITQGDADDVDAFYMPINPDEHTILLTRYNEPLITNDNREYKALHGGWTEKVNIEIYRINTQYPNGILVDPSEYSINNIEGLITFYTGQSPNDSFTITIEVYPSFRLVCNITNYGSKRAVIQHIGIVYNMMKRVPTNDNGNIIHTPINSRIS